MELRAVQWNIGGAFVRKPGDDASREGSYTREDLPYVIDRLQSYKPDLVTLQESHATDSHSQAEAISQALGFQYFINDPYDNSHIDPTQKLCQTIISRFPIKEHSFSLFHNPHYGKTMEDGSEWVSHDKGISTVAIDIGNTILTIQTLHLIPFTKFDVDMAGDANRKVLLSIENAIENEKSPYLLQGDFNFPNVKSLLNNIFSGELHEVGGDTPTTPKGRIYDHVLYRGLKVISGPIIDSNVVTDHYPIVCQFEL